MLSLGPITGQRQVICLGRKMKCPDRDPAHSRRFCVRLELEVIVTSDDKQRKQKKRLERIGSESGRCTRFVVRLYELGLEKL